MKKGDFVKLDQGKIGKVLSIGDDITKLVVATKDKGQQVLTVIEVVNDLLNEVIPPVAEFIEDVKQMFSRLPDKIEIEGQVYELVLNPGRRKDIDVVSFQREAMGKEYWANPLLGNDLGIISYVLLRAKAETMYQAKTKMKGLLKLYGLM